MINTGDLTQLAILLNMLGYTPGGGGGGGITALQVQQFAFNFAGESGADDAFVVNLNPAVLSLTNGLVVCMISNHTNLTTTPTLQINSTAPTQIVNIIGTDLIPGDVVAGGSYILVYNATNNVFQIINPTISLVNAYLLQKNYFNYAPDIGAANAYVGNFVVPPLNALSDGVVAYLEVANANTGASTFNLNSSGVVDLVNSDGSDLSGGELAAGMLAQIGYSTALSKWILMNPINVGGGGGVTSSQVQQSAFNTGTDSGIADAYVVNLTPAVTSYTNGMIVSFNPANANVGYNPTLELNSAGAKGIFLTGVGSNQSCQPGDLNPNTTAYCIYNASLGFWNLLNPASQPNSQLVQNNFYNSGTDTGTANNYIVDLSPAPVNPMTGLTIAFIPANNNTITNPTITVNSLSAATITRPGGAPLLVGDLNSGDVAYMIFSANTGTWTLLNPAVVSQTPPTFDAISGATQAMVSNTDYYTTNAAGTVFTLPTTGANAGDPLIVSGSPTSGVWSITVGAGQNIQAGSTNATTSATANAGTDNIHLTCVVANTTWRVDFAYSAGINYV